MALFYVKDADRPMWVIARDWTKALDKWRNLIATEATEKLECSDENPLGIDFVCDEDELIQ